MQQDEMLRVAVLGASGRMGQEVLRALTPAEGFEIAVAIDRENVGKNCRELVGVGGPDVVIEQKLGQALDRTPVDVVIDFSLHSAAASHAESAIRRGINPVIGCTGLSDADLRELKLLSTESGVNAMYIPNFAVGAVLMMHFAQLAARWLPDAEIVEMHHDKKEDAPSGTAIRTAEMIAEGRTRPAGTPGTGFLKLEGARGGRFCETQIHSVRLPGLVAHQRVIFGGEGEVLTLQHDGLDRHAYMVGVKLALRSVKEFPGFTVGLDRILLRRTN